MTYNDQIEDMETQRKRMLKARLDSIDMSLERWLEAKRNGGSVLTEDQIEFLRVLAERNFNYRNRKQGLNDNQRVMKSKISSTLGNAFSDINRMICYGFIGRESEWNPGSYNPNESSLPYDPKIWMEAFPVYEVCRFVEALVDMYGDEYGVPIANAVQKGLQSREGWDSQFIVDVPVQRRSKSISSP